MDLPTPRQLERVLFDAVAREPDAELIDRPDWMQVRTPSSSRPNHNAIVVARLTEGEADARIAAVLAEHAARGATLRWIVGPSSGPPNLSARLEAAGLKRLGHTLGLAMRVPPDERPLDVAGLSVHEVGPENLDEYVDVTTRGWGGDREFAAALRYIGAKAFVGERRSWSWIARIDGVSVATSHMRALGTIGYFQGCAVLPAFRARGIYRDMLHHRLAVLRSWGTPLAVVWARASGSGRVCSKLGFTTLTSAEFFESVPL